MAKKIIAVTAIKGSEETRFAPGEEVPQDVFGKDELKSLYDNGAIRLEDVPDTRQASNEPTGPDTTVPEQTEAPTEE